MRMSGKCMSKKYSLNKEDFKRIGIGALVALVGALLTYLETLIPNVDFGNWTPVAVAINSILANAVRKYIADNQ